ncbi:MAG: metallophosphoesterase [Anaerolineae bacterium]|nr:metallophosphoesterase [Anaerolineae bacterium]
MECHPAILVLGAALLTVASVLSGTAVLTLTGRRHKAGAIIGHVLSLTLAFLAFCVSDWALMEMLSYLRVSFSTDPRWSLFFSTLVRTLLLWGLLLLVVLTILLHQDRPAQGSPRKSKSLSPFTVFLAANLAISALEAYAYIIEPLAVETTHLTLAFDDLDAQAPPVRIVHLTDIHVERFGPRETAIIRQVNALKPDLILLTGDYLNLSYLTDPTAIAHFRELLAQLQAPHGAYAVRGSLESEPEYMARLVEGTGVRWLEQEAVTVEVRGQRVTLVGVACSHKQWRDTARLAEAMKGLPADAFTILLYHSPDLIHEVATYEVDLYLAGHTHGGQIRLPLYGAIITGSAYGQRYASGLFREGSTTMYVSRGIGLEGGAAPRVRFLSRPEVVSIDLVGK